MRVYIYEHHLRWYWKLFVASKRASHSGEVIARCPMYGYATKRQCKDAISITKTTLNKLVEF